MDEAIDESKERRAFGKPISDFQLIQAKIADMAVKVDAMALLIYRSAWVKDVQDVRVTRRIPLWPNYMERRRPRK